MFRQISSYLLLVVFLCFNNNLHAQETARDPFHQPVQQAVTQPKIAYQATPITPNLRIQTYQLSYAQANELQETLTPLFQGKISVDKITNSILLQSTEEEHVKLKAMLQKLDIATKQVTLEAKIIALNQEYGKSLGVSWNWDTVPQRSNYNDNENNSDSKNTDNNFGGRFNFWHGYAFHFNATLNALISNGKAKILARPHIITIPGREASIFIGDHIPVQTEKHDSSGTYTATEYLDAGIKLQYTPLISQDGKMVTAKVHTEVSTPVLISELRNYRITSRTADTNVRMFSGEPCNKQYEQ